MTKGTATLLCAQRNAHRHSNYAQSISCRQYHDHSYGYREPRKFTLPDCKFLRQIIMLFSYFTFCYSRQPLSVGKPHNQRSTPTIR